MLAQSVTQCLMQQMRRRVVCPDRITIGNVNFKFYRIPNLHRAVALRHMMGMNPPQKLIGALD